MGILPLPTTPGVLGGWSTLFTCWGGSQRSKRHLGLALRAETSLGCFIPLKSWESPFFIWNFCFFRLLLTEHDRKAISLRFFTKRAFFCVFSLIRIAQLSFSGDKMLPLSFASCCPIFSLAFLRKIQMKQRKKDTHKIRFFRWIYCQTFNYVLLMM